VSTLSIARFTLLILGVIEKGVIEVERGNLDYTT
jgi:hypothetical protein